MEGGSMRDVIFLALIFGGFGLCWLGVLACESL